MLELMRPMIESALRHGLTSLATLLLAAAVSHPYAQALVVATGLNNAQITNLIVGVGMAAFVTLWSLTKGVKLIQLSKALKAKQ